MKRLLVVLFIFLMHLSFSHAMNFTNSSFNVIVDLPATEEWAEVELNTTEIDFGELNLSDDAGVSAKEEKRKYKIRNRGNINISVTPILENENDEIFENLWFARIYTETWRKIGNYSIKMNRTEVIGDWNGWYEYSIKLDLRDYTDEHGPIPFDIYDNQNKVNFWVMPRYD